MKKNDKTKKIIIIAVVALVGLFLLFSSMKDTGTTTPTKTTIGDKIKDVFDGGGSTDDRGNNGWYHPETDECWSTPTGLQGGKLPMYYCCGDSEGYQVECTGDKRLSSTPVYKEIMQSFGILDTFAIYQPEGELEVPNKYTLTTSIGLSNTANVGFSKVWIDSVDFTASPAYVGTTTTGETYIDNLFNAVEGYTNAKAGPLAQSGNYLFSVGTLNLQGLSPSQTVEEKYTGTVIAKGTYLEGSVEKNYSTTKVVTFNVTKEEVGFNVAVSLVAS